MKIYPRDNLSGIFSVPPDKSITQRAIILGSVASGKTIIVNPLICSDTQATINCIKKLGAKVKFKNGAIEIRRGKKLKDGQKLDCGNSGTTMRMMCGLVAGSGLKAVLVGDKQLAQRPMRMLKEPLEEMGSTVALTNYSVAPILVEGAHVRPIDYTMTVGSAQIKSAILMCALQGNVRARIVEKLPTRIHTELLMMQMGANITIKECETILEPSELKGKTIHVCGDFSSAMYFIALGLMCGKVTCRNVGINPTRTGILNVLNRMGAKIEVKNKRILCGELIADITAYKSKLRATHVLESEISIMNDDLTILAVLMGNADGESIIYGMDSMPYKEITKANAIAEMINSVGGKCKAFNGGVVINGVSKYFGGIVKTYGDHRIALSASIALVASEIGGEIDNDNCIAISFPGFFDRLKENSFAMLARGNSALVSKDINAFILEKFNLRNYTYSYMNVNEDGLRRAFVELKELTGYNISSPYKSEAVKHVLKSKGIAKSSRSVDTIMGYSGYSTDGAGFLYMLKNNKVEVGGKTVLVLGVGSVGKSIICSLVENKARVDVYASSYRDAVEFKKKFEMISILKEIPNNHYDIIVNTTPIGGGFYEGELPLPESLLRKCDTVVDVIYSPAKTALIKVAEKLGKTCLCGDELLFYSAYISACMFCDKGQSENEAHNFYGEFLQNKSDKIANMA